MEEGQPGEPAPRSAVRARLAPLALGVIGATLTAVILGTALTEADTVAPWWAVALLLLPALSMTALGFAAAAEPRRLVLRQALAGTAMLWLLFLAPTALLLAAAGQPIPTIAIVGGVALVIAAAMLGLAVTTADVAPNVTEHGALGRFGVIAAFAVAIAAASIALVVVAIGVLAVLRTVTEGRLPERLPWGAFVAILLLPAVTFVIAAIGTRRAAGGTFHAQAAANRRNSLLLLVTLVGVVAATAEVITASVTLQAAPALAAAGVAAIVGLGAAAGADRFGSDLIIRSAGANETDDTSEPVLVNVVRELSLAAAIPMPRVYVIEDGSQNAFATGRDPQHASVAVTRGLLERLDREQLQGVIGHELGHVRNLDTRYSLYVAVLVGLVALVTDGFLRIVVEGWKEGAFIWGRDADDLKGAAASFVTGLFVGLFLLAIAVVLRVVAPLFATMVQAATSREREYLADATSVEFTRNPRALERALTAIATDDDPLEAANRGTQHLWFRNPVKAGADSTFSLFATHPSITARVGRLRVLQGLTPVDPESELLGRH